MSAEYQAKAERLAHARGLTFSAYLRQLIDEDHARSAPRGDISVLFNMLGDEMGPTDFANETDDLIKKSVLMGMSD